MAVAKLFDHLNQPVVLGAKIGTGGEGTVFEIVNSSEIVAKVYHKPLQSHRETKLRAMIGLSRKELLKFAAWPTATLHERPGGAVRGLVMRKIKGFNELHTLYNPGHRKTTFPQADWRSLISVAMNCAAAFDALHEGGVIMGDVNERNVLVSAEGKIALIDCDSFQVKWNGQTYPCEVGVDIFTPPELQGKSFRGLIRTVNHDRFGLAVLIFLLLFMGKHPFSGRYLGPGEMPPLERAISQYRFAYGRAAHSFQTKPPPDALPLSAVSSQLVELFERAFGQSSGTPNVRPTPSEWHSALKAFAGSLHTCSSDSGHVYSAHLQNCPWCILMSQGAPNLFISVGYYRASGPRLVAAFDLDVVWARIEKMSRPPSAYTRPATPPAGKPAPWPANLPKALPPPPALPPILKSPPAPPPRTLARPKHQKVVVPPGSLQNVVGITAISSGAGLGSLGLGAICLGGSVSIVVLLLCAASIGFLVFGVCWLVLERKRQVMEQELNQEYFEELANLRRAARQEREAWERQLAIEQSKARQRYEQAVRQWEEVRAALQGEAKRRRQAVEETTQTLLASEQRWLSAARQAGAQFDQTKDRLRRGGDQHRELAKKYIAERQSLYARAKDIQFRHFLQQHFISDHKIPDIGLTRTATLTSFGIETALDIQEDRILEIPGFGQKLAQRLVDWRRSVESRFVFNPAAGIPPHEQQALDSKYAQARQPIEAALFSGEAELKSIALRAEGELRQLYEHVRSTLQQFAQAHADLAVIPPGI
jgi:DNA-binding helix-hairpin-helix protein with protein kinase domain